MKKPKNIPTYYTFPGTKIFRDTTALPFADGGPLNDRNIKGKLLQSTYAPPLGNMFREGGPFGKDRGAFDYAQSVYAPELGNYYAQGGMIKRADGSYSPRGLWDNIRANAGSGKKPTKQMLAQEKKINKQYKEGGPLLTKLTPEEEKQFQQFYQSLPDNLMQDDPEYDIRGYWDSEGRPQEFNFNQPKEDDGYYHAYSINQNTGEYLKSPSHHTFQRAIDEDRKIGYRPVTNVQGRNIATENESIIPPQEQSFLANTQGPVNFRTGGQFPRPYSLPEDSFKQGGRGLHNSVYASSSAQYPAVYNFGGTLKNNLATRQQMYMPLDHITRNGGSILSMSNTPELSGEGKDLTVPDNAYYYANGGPMGKPWLNNLYPDGGGLFQKWRNRNQVIETPVQNLPEVTVYGNTENAAKQKNLMLKLEEMRRAFSTMRKDSGYGAGEVDVQQKSSIAGLKHNIQIYKKALEDQKALSAKAQQALNVLQKHDPENWKDKSVRDIIENPQSVEALRDLYSKDKITEGTFRDFYDNFGKWTDIKTAKGSGPDATYSGKEAREKWGKSEHWKDFTDKVNTVATAIPLIGAAGALVNPGSLSILGNGTKALFANPYIGGAMNAYGLYNLPHGVNQTYNDFNKGNYATGVFNGAMTALDALPIAGGIRYAKNLVPGVKNVYAGKANFMDLFRPADMMTVRAPQAHLDVTNETVSSPTFGRYYGDTGDTEQIKYWPQEEVKGADGKVILGEDGKPLQQDSPTAFIKTRLGGTRASLAHLRIDNLKNTGKWNRRITNPDGTMMSRAETGAILQDIHNEKLSLQKEKDILLAKLAAGNKSAELKGRLSQISARQEKLYGLLDDAAFTVAPQRSIPRPEEFDSKLEKIIQYGIDGKPVNLNEKEIDALRYITQNHSNYWKNPEVAKLLEESPHLKNVLESSDFSSSHEYILPLSANASEFTKPDFMNLLSKHNDRAFLNSYYHNNPTKKYSPFALATEANLLRNKLLQNPVLGAGNIAYHGAPYMDRETIPYLGGQPEEHKEQTPISEPKSFEERDITNEVLPNPWAAPTQNIFGLRTGGQMGLDYKKKFPTFTNRFIK
jgi:hypothetical protein